MSWVRVWIHLVFTTKDKEKILSEKIRKEVFMHIKTNAKQKEIKIDCVNGYLEHVHCLFLLNKEQTISKSVGLIKGESSHWINEKKFVRGKFSWQDDYWAVSVSESHVNAVRKYIHGQEEHHRKKSYAEEIDEFMKKYGWKYVKE
jgi:REP element-mobilizing transposase RayT